MTGVASLTEWGWIVSLVFGGCCSNAWALESVVNDLPSIGTLLTFAQFFLISLYGLSRNLTWDKTTTLSREDLLGIICKEISSRKKRGPDDSLLVAIDDGDIHAPGSSNFAAGLEASLKLAGFSVLRTNIGTLNHPPEVRNLGSCEYHSLSQKLLVPLGPKGPKICLTQSDIIEVSTGASHSNWTEVPPSTILILEGSFLHGKELREHWDFSVFLDTNLLDSKGAKNLSSENDKASLQSMMSYLSRDCPRERATWVVHNKTSEWLLQRRHDLHAKLLSPRLRTPHIPVSKWFLQVVLFLATSLLNNMAFAYRVSMPVHIIFRSGGMVMNVILGCLVGKRYSLFQILSVFVVTVGVITSTYSAASDDFAGRSGSYRDYAIGVSILTVALALSAIMGLAQDRMYARYGRGHWQEALFYLHFLSMPMFIPLVPRISEEFATAMKSIALTSTPSTSGLRAGNKILLLRSPGFSKALISVALTVVTQLVCVSGVHRLTSRVDSLTVALILVLRKAISLFISIKKGSEGIWWLWGGAGMVLLGTVGYAYDQRNQSRARAKTD